MSNYLSPDDIAFEDAFASKQLLPSQFDHAAHIRLAWIHLTRYGLDLAIKNIFHQLKEFVVSAGGSDKFHVTLTIASIQVVNHFICKSSCRNFLAFSDEFPQLFFEFKKLVNSHYSNVVLYSEMAKNNWLEPDLQPFGEYKWIGTELEKH